MYDVGVDEQGQHFQVMQFLEGETLEAVIDRLRADDPAAHARFTHAYRAQVFAAILEAVEYAHARGLIHRDLKPANVMIGPHGEVTVLDRGIAKRVGDAGPDAPAEAGADAPPAGVQPADAPPPRLVKTIARTILGTPRYMSPEQVTGDPSAVGARSDVYSLGVMFWEFMSLRHPYEDLTKVAEIVAALSSQEISTNWLMITRIRAAAPCEWAWFARRATYRDPAKRHPSARAMLLDLRRVQRRKFPASCPTTLAKRSMHEVDFWIDRHGVAFNLLFALATVTAFVGLLRVARDLLR